MIDRNRHSILSDMSLQLDNFAGDVRRASQRQSDQPERGKILHGIRERQVPVVGRLQELYSFFYEAEDMAPTGFDDALQRFETMQELLVHPTIDYVLTEIGDSILEENQLLSLAGSTGNGAAMIRTLAGADGGLGSTFIPSQKPDVDLILLSTNPGHVDLAEREATRNRIMQVLTGHKLRLDSSFNPLETAFTLDKIWDYYRNGNETMEAFPDESNFGGFVMYSNTIAAPFNALYPKEKGCIVRTNLLEKVKALGKTDPVLQDELIARLTRFKRRSLRYSPKHLGISDSDMRKGTSPFTRDQFQEVSDYFTDKVTGVFSDLVDTTRSRTAR